MFKILLRFDAWVGRTRHWWAWIGQLALVWLGVHLAADRLDDLVSTGLAASGIPWPEPEQPLSLGTWTAVALELYVAAWAVVALARATAPALPNAKSWLQRATPHAIVAPLFFGVVGAGGAWGAAMAVEDLVAPVAPSVGAAAGLCAALVVAWRIVVPAWWRLIRCTPIPPHRWDGAVLCLPAILVAIVAARYGLPLWGWTS